MKILLLLITQNVGGVEKRFYNYCKYIADKTDNNYTVVVSRSLINSLGEIKFDNHNKIKNMVLTGIKNEVSSIYRLPQYSICFNTGF